MNVTDIFVRRPVLATMVSVLIFLAGLRAFQELPVRQFPRVDSTVISITTVYPGATSELMRSFITTPIEQAVSTADGLDYLTSSSFSSRSIVTAHIKLNFDPGRALTEVLAKVQQVKYLIPPGALDPVITKTTGQVTPALFMGFSSESMSSVAISEPCRAASARLTAGYHIVRDHRRPGVRHATVARSSAHGRAGHLCG